MANRLIFGNAMVPIVQAPVQKPTYVTSKIAPLPHFNPVLIRGGVPGKDGNIAQVTHGQKVINSITNQNNVRAMIPLSME
jgi:hypothetical protein